MTMTRDECVDGLIRRLKAEFLEMPGLKLTQAQARKLWALDATLCSDMLETLVKANFLFRTRDGAFMRIERTAPEKASLVTERPPASAA